MRTRLHDARFGRMSLLSFQDIITSVTGILILVTLILTFYIQPAATSGGGPDLHDARLRDVLLEIDRVTDTNRAMAASIESARSAPGDERLDTEISHLRNRLEQGGRRLADLDAIEAANAAADRTRREELGMDRLASELAAMAEELDSLSAAEPAIQEEIERIDARLPDLEDRHRRAQRERHRVWLIPEAETSRRKPILVTLSGTGISIQPFDDPAPPLHVPATATTQFTDYLRSIRPEDVYLVFLLRPSGIPHFAALRDSARAAGFETGYDPLEEDAEMHAGPPPDPGTP